MYNSEQVNHAYNSTCLKTNLLYQLYIIRPPIFVPDKSSKVKSTKRGIIFSNYFLETLSKHFTIHLMHISKEARLR